MIRCLRVLLLAYPVALFAQSGSTSDVLSIEQIAQAAEQARNQNRDDEAIRLYGQGLELRPDWDEGLWYLATLQYEKEHFAEARDLLRHFVAQNPKHGPAWALLGLSEYKNREYTRALTHLEQSLTFGLGDRKELATSVFYFKAVLLIRFEQYHDALSLLYQMRGTGQDQGPLEEPAGLAVLGYPLLPEEVPAPRHELVRLAGAGTFARTDQRREEAEKLFRKMVDDFPAEPGVHYQYGLLLLEDRPQEGIEEMHKELSLSPSHIPARLRLAEFYLAQSQPEKARPLLDEVLKLEPSDASGHLLMGTTLTSTGDNTGAIRELELAKTLAPGRGRVLWALLRAYMAAGRRDDADRIKAEIEKSGQSEPPK